MIIHILAGFILSSVTSLTLASNVVGFERTFEPEASVAVAEQHGDDGLGEHGQKLKNILNRLLYEQSRGEFVSNDHRANENKIQDQDGMVIGNNVSAAVEYGKERQDRIDQEGEPQETETSVQNPGLVSSSPWNRSRYHTRNIQKLKSNKWRPTRGNDQDSVASEKREHAEEQFALSGDESNGAVTEEGKRKEVRFNGESKRDACKSVKVRMLLQILLEKEGSTKRYLRFPIVVDPDCVITSTTSRAEDDRDAKRSPEIEYGSSNAVLRRSVNKRPKIFYDYLGPKRNWKTNLMRVWGKRSEADDRWTDESSPDVVDQVQLY